MDFVSLGQIEKSNKERAHTYVGRAIKSGRLIPSKTCEKCGKNPGKGKDGRNLIQAHHHKGYEPKYIYDVKWLCISCHRIEHPSGLQQTPWVARWQNKLTCPAGHDNNFGTNNRGHRFCRTCANEKRRLKRVS